MASIYTLIFLNVLIYVTPALSSGNYTQLVRFPEDFIARYGFSVPALEEGEWSRLFSAMFLHGYWFHLLLNMFLLLGVGRIVRQFYRYDSKILLIYFVCGVAGFLTHLLYYDDTFRVSIGASGAILGLFGALIIPSFVMGYPAYACRLIGVSLFQLWLDRLLPIVDAAAHLGGLCTGIVLSVGLFSATHTLVRRPGARS